MTATEAAGLALCAAVTTARSSELTTTRRTTAARDRMDPTPARMTPPQTGGPGQAGDVWLQGLSGGSRSAGAVGVLSTTGGWAASTPRRDTPTLTAFSFSSLNCHVKFELFREINNLRRSCFQLYILHGVREYYPCMTDWPHRAIRPAEYSLSLLS